MDSLRRGSDRGGTSSEASGQTLKPLLGNMALCLAIIFAGWYGVTYLMNDISGVYVLKGRGGAKVAQLTLLKEATTLDGEMSLGRHGFLEMEHTQPPKGKSLLLRFLTPRSAIEKGKPERTVEFEGTVKDSDIVGTLRIEGKSMDVTFNKDPGASIFAVLQSKIELLLKPVNWILQVVLKSPFSR